MDVATNATFEGSSESLSTNSKNSFMYDACIYYHPTDYDLAVEIKTFLETIITCDLYDMISTGRNKNIEHIHQLLLKCNYVLLLITENFQKDSRTKHIKNELVQEVSDKITIIKNKKIDDFGTQSFTQIQWQDQDRAKKQLKAQFSHLKERPKEQTRRINIDIMQIGANNTINIGEANKNITVLQNTDSLPECLKQHLVQSHLAGPMTNFPSLPAPHYDSN